MGSKRTACNANNVKALEYLLKWLDKDQILPAEPSTALITALFNDGKAAMIFNGPWFLGEISKNIDYGLALLPKIKEAGNTPMKPWMTVEGALIAAPSKSKDAAYDFIKYLTGSRPNSQKLLTFKWAINGGETTSFTTGATCTIRDSAGYDDTPILHEWSHYAMYFWSKSSNPGGTHFLSNCNEDLRLAFDEGRATFFGCSVRRYNHFPNANVYLKTDGNIREVVRAIITSPEFFSQQAFHSKVKSPFEVVVSAMRALNAAPDSTPRTALSVAYLGQPIYGHQAPNGWPETGESWMNTGAILNRINTRFGWRLPCSRFSSCPISLFKKSARRRPCLASYLTRWNLSTRRSEHGRTNFSCSAAAVREMSWTTGWKRNAN